jgi:predicted ATP-dependent endonuclease of OLD family
MIYKFKTEEAGIGFDFDVEFEQNQKVNCIIGKNGIGKTQLLENMIKSLIYRHSMFLNSGEHNYKNLFMQKNILEKTKELELKLPLAIELNGVEIKNKERQNWGYTTFENIAGNRDDSFVFDKPIVFIGAKNRGFTKNINPNNIKILGSSQDRFVESITRTMSYINGDGLEHEEIANWFVSRLIVNPNFVIANQNKTNEVIAVLKLIEKLEPSLKLVIPNENGGNSLSMLYHDGQLLLNNIPLNKLSTGFVSIVKIFQEIIAGYGGWSNLNDLSRVDGVVFIDEIEAHLHISWQTKIINILKDFFQNTTFYITTHSPLVLAGLKDGEAYELYKEDNFVKTKAITNVDNYALNDIVNEFFGVDLNREKIDNPSLDKQNKARALLLNLTKSLDGDK